MAMGWLTSRYLPPGFPRNGDMRGKEKLIKAEVLFSLEKSLCCCRAEDMGS